MTVPALQVSSLSFSYENSEVLTDINFLVEPGEYVTLIGPNGSGKSTLLKCLNRLLNTDSSNIKIFGRDIGLFTQKELAKTIGYVPQQQGELPAYTVEEFVLMGRYSFLKPFQSYSSMDTKITNDILQLTGIAHLKSRLIHQLSGGERQKVYIASALVQQPKILLLDEPTTHLDPNHNIEVQKLISRVCHDYQMTIIHVTHDLTHIQRFSQKVIALKQGRILFNGPTKEVLTPARLEKIFSAPFQFFYDQQTSYEVIVPRI